MVTLPHVRDAHGPAPIQHDRDDGIAIPRYTVPARLAAYLYRCEGFVEHGVASVRRRELPLVGTPIVLAFGSPYRLSLATEPSRPVRTSQQFVAGLHDTYSTSESTGPNWLIQIDLTPIGAYRILGMPLQELTNRIATVDEILGPEARRLVSNLEATSTWTDRFEFVESFLIDRLAMSSPEANGMTWAWRQLANAHGLVSIRSIADELGWSQRHLIRCFREQIGMPPKKVARQLRFQHAVDLLTVRSNQSLAGVADMAGYFDQAHFARDFREFSGSTPAAYRRAALERSRALT